MHGRPILSSPARSSRVANRADRFPFQSQDGNGTAQTNTGKGIRVAHTKSSLRRGRQTLLPVALLPSQLSGTVSYASTANSILAMPFPWSNTVGRAFTPRHSYTRTSPHNGWAELTQLPPSVHFAGATLHRARSTKQRITFERPDSSSRQGQNRAKQRRTESKAESRAW